MALKLETVRPYGIGVRVIQRQFATRWLVALLFASGLVMQSICPLLHADAGGVERLAIHGTHHSHGGNHSLECAPTGIALADHSVSPELPTVILVLDRPVQAQAYRRAVIPVSLDGGSPPPALPQTIPLRV